MARNGTTTMTADSDVVKDIHQLQFEMQAAAGERVLLSTVLRKLIETYRKCHSNESTECEQTKDDQS
jgi:cytosine/adenosine deaminase-related metal-dependent hydrolase